MGFTAAHTFVLLKCSNGKVSATLACQELLCDIFAKTDSEFGKQIT